MSGQPHEHNTGGYNKQNNTLSFWGVGLWIKSDCTLSCDLWSFEFSPAGPAHGIDEQAPGTWPTDIPPFVTKGFGSRSCTWQATLSAFVCCAACASWCAAAAASPPVLLGLDSQLTCLHKQNTSPLRSALSHLSVSSPKAIHRDL